MNRLGILRLALVGMVGLIAACAAPPPDEADRVQRAITYCSTNCDCPAPYVCWGGQCGADFSPLPQCRGNCDCSAGQACSNGFCATIGSSCSWVGGPYQGCSQYMSVWCSYPGQSLYAQYYVGPNPSFCGSGNSEYAVYCNQPGTIQSDGSCQ